ncbi:MAG: hypothetical protein F6K55_09670 [Moorea sp. SIO4A3]|nr:hypothetical protein [Moorena sp. SIO4A3]
MRDSQRRLRRKRGLRPTLRERPSRSTLAYWPRLAVGHAKGEREREQPSTNQPSTNQPSTNQPSTNQPSTNQPSTNQPWPLGHAIAFNL